MKGIFLVILSIFLSSCHASKDANKLEQASSPVFDEDKNYIVSVLLQFEKNADGSDNAVISVSDIITAEGFLKGNSNALNDPYSKERYLAEFMSYEGRILKELILTDPLNKSVEYVDDDGQLARKDVSIDKEVVLLRINRSEDLEKLIISEIGEDKKSKITSFLIN